MVANVLKTSFSFKRRLGNGVFKCSTDSFIRIKKNVCSYVDKACSRKAFETKGSDVLSIMTV